MFDDVWRTHQLYGLLFASGLFCYLTINTMGKAYALALFYSLASAIWLFQNPVEVWPGLMIRIDATSANAAIILVLTSAIAAFLSIDKVKKLFLFLTSVVFINCIIVLFRGNGLFNVSSMDLAVAALFLPVMIYVANKYFFDGLALLILVPIVAIFTYHGRTGVIMISTMSLLFLWWKGKRKTALAILVFVALPVLVWAVLKAIETNRIEQMSGIYGRLSAWREAFEWWVPNANLFFGTGTGSYQWIGPSIANRKTQVYLFLHNEYLQTLFEQGILGLVLWGAVAFNAFKKTIFTNFYLFTTLVLLAVMSFTQYPFRFFITQLAAVLLIRLAQETETPADF